MQRGVWFLVMIVGSGTACGRTSVFDNLSEGDIGGSASAVLGGSPSLAGRVDSAGGRDNAGHTAGAGPNTSGGTSGVGGAAHGEGGRGGAGGDPLACEDALTGDLLDPNRVYLAGTLSEGACYRDALASIACPNVAATGFDCAFDAKRAQIASNGRLIYVNTFEERLREFHCDNCPLTDTLHMQYPVRPLVNDPLLSDVCPKQLATLQFFVAPEGATMYRCVGSPWQELGGSRTYAPPPDDDLLHLGYGGLALTQKRVLNLDSGAAADIVSLPAGAERLAIRARPSESFWVALSAQESQELWEIDALGNGQRLGNFPALPPGLNFSGNSALEASGALLTMTTGPGMFEESIVRRTIDGESRVVYGESSKPLVKIHISGLITGG